MGSGDFTIRCGDTDQSGRLLTCSKGWGRNVVWNQASWLALIHAGGQREISTLCELVSYTTLRCGLAPSHCGLVIIAGWKRRTAEQSGRFAAADDGRVFDTVFCTFLTASRGTSEQIKTDAFIISEDLTWNDFSVGLQRFGRLQQSASCKSNRIHSFFPQNVGAERVKRFLLDGGAGRQVASAEEWRFALSLPLFVLCFSSGNLCSELGNKESLSDRTLVWARNYLMVLMVFTLQSHVGDEEQHKVNICFGNKCSLKEQVLGKSLCCNIAEVGSCERWSRHPSRPCQHSWQGHHLDYFRCPICPQLLLPAIHNSLSS